MKTTTIFYFIGSKVCSELVPLASLPRISGVLTYWRDEITVEGSKVAPEPAQEAKSGELREVV